MRENPEIEEEPSKGTVNGFCAQGESAGSAAIAYSLAYYGLGDSIDNAEFLAGPPLSDIKPGCQFPPPPIVITICGQHDNSDGTQIGCKLGQTYQTWSMDPGYLIPAVNGVRRWTADTTCHGVSTTSAASNQAWYQASIVDDGTNGPTFVYPKTAMSGWLCRGLQDQKTQQQCSISNFDQNHCPNNTGPQGQVFYARITSGGITPPKSYSVFAVDSCNGPEGVDDDQSNVPGYVLGQSWTGFSAISDDMQHHCVNNH
jgi:hypothetical protein